MSRVCSEIPVVVPMCDRIQFRDHNLDNKLMCRNLRQKGLPKDAFEDIMQGRHHTERRRNRHAIAFNERAI